MSSTRLAILITTLILGAVFVTDADQYSYGEKWWTEYLWSKDTQVLLHFGPPQTTAGEKLAQKSKKEKETVESVLEGTMDSSDVSEPDAMREVAKDEMDPEAYKKGPDINLKTLEENEVQDYATVGRRPEMPDGMEKVPDGRFGGGLKCSAPEKGVELRDTKGLKGQSFELSFKIAEYPDETQCLLSIAGDESRILLHPDGRVEFKRRKPHGNPGKYATYTPKFDRLSPERKKQILEKDATIISKPVPLNEWVHARVYKIPHPMPGPSPWDAALDVNGRLVDHYLSGKLNSYDFFGENNPMTVGNSAEGDQGFTGLIDEVRVLKKGGTFYSRPDMPWRHAEHELQFDRPWFRDDCTLFHAPTGKNVGFALNKGQAEKIDLPTENNDPGPLLVEGIRQKGWAMFPHIGFAKIPLSGMDVREGALEFWMRPLNWDDVTGFWSHSPPPHMHLTVARFFGRDRRDGEIKPFMGVKVPRAHARDGSGERVPLDAGHWTHVTVSWWKHNLGKAHATLQSVNNSRKGARVWRKKELVKHVEPLYVKLGIPDNVEVKRYEKPRMEIDEVIGYSMPLDGAERKQAYKRWQGKLDPIKLYKDRLSFKWSIQKLTYTWWPRLPRKKSADTLDVTLRHKQNGEWEKIEHRDGLPVQKGKAMAVLNEGEKMAHGRYRIAWTAHNADGEKVLEGHKNWHYEESEWRHYTGGILDTPPKPWTPIEVRDGQLGTRMSRYKLNDTGLPAEIVADGKNLLAGPIRLLEKDAQLKAGDYQIDKKTPTKVRWHTTFTGDSADIRMNCRLEYDGMIRYELDIQPKTDTVQPLRFEIPLKDAMAKRYLYSDVRSAGVKTGVVPSGKQVLASRVDPVSWRGYKKVRKKNPELGWHEYRQQLRAGERKHNSYGFFGQVDLNDMNRGLFWFADNAVGWRQSNTVSAIKVVREGDSVVMRFNLVAEPGAYKKDEPIVFGIIPHPARPMPEHYRVLDRAPAKENRRLQSVFDAFRGWPKSPRSHNMDIHPKKDWEYAETCIPSMKNTKPDGYRTMYLSLKWMSCRAGRYDNWEWRSGDSGSVALTPSFVNYLSWEMNEWIGRDIFTAVYLDESYDWPLYNVQADMSVRLPNGKVQPGVNNFQFRALMKRWYNLFVKHDRDPMILAHLTRCFQYPGLIYTQAFLDGENSPIVSLGNSWIGRTSKTSFEVLQNGYMWGITPFYMPCISEGGFGSEQSKYPVWQWRMARQAQSMFAHYEVGTVYEGQGGGVYKRYWNDVYSWGAKDADKVPFHPYWKNSQYLSVKNQGDKTLVSFYQDDGRILVVASNRRKKRHTAEVKLDLDKLDMSSPLTVKDIDSGFEQPEGREYVSGKQAEKMAEEASGTDKSLAERMKSNDSDDGMSLSTDDLKLEEESEREKNPLKVQTDGNKVLIPVRPRDFRLISVESNVQQDQ